jgi:hypothetical protein
MVVCPGRVLGVFAEKKSYDVLLDGKTTVEATIIETGTDFTLLRHDRVACIFLKNVGWKIVGKYRTPKTTTESDEQKKTTAERIAEEQDWLNSILTGKSLDTSPSYREDGEEPLLEGEVALKSLVNNSSVSIFNDGSIVSKITDALLWLLSKSKSAALLSAKRFIIRCIPGVKIEMGLKETGETQNPDTTVKPKVALTAGIASDPAKPKEVDFFLEMGDIDPKAAQYGESLKTQKQALVRGLKFLMKNFSIAEADNDKGEIRLTYLQSAEKKDPLGNPFQVRMNEDEIVLSWGSQFISFTSTGLMIKADRLGLAGPIDMWSPEEVAKFSHQTGFPDPLVPDPVTIEWHPEGLNPGIRITKSVYFGQNKEPALLESFVEKRYKFDWDQYFQHTHQAGPIQTATPTQAILHKPAFETGVSDPILMTMMSLVQVKG